MVVAELPEPDSVDLVTVLTHDSQTAGITSLHRDEGYFHSKRLLAQKTLLGDRVQEILKCA